MHMDRFLLPDPAWDGEGGGSCPHCVRGWKRCSQKHFCCLPEDGQRPEWTFYPRLSTNIHTYHVGKQCRFNGVFLGNRRSCSERTVDKCLGRKKYGIANPLLTPGLQLCGASFCSPVGSSCLPHVAKKTREKRGLLGSLYIWQRTHGIC